MLDYDLAPVVLVEGFDIVGKTSFINKQLVNELGYTTYHTTHDTIDKVVGSDHRWVTGYGIIDMISQIYNTHKLNLAIDRGVFSSYVYNKLYGNDLSSDVINYYINNEFFHSCNISHIYVQPNDKSTSEYLFNLSKSRPENDNEISRKYDQFSTFDDYWSMYLKAESLFIDAYQIIGVKPIIVNTLRDFKYTIRT